jgi:hypothetical protein
MDKPNRMPVYVKIEDYKEVLDIMNLIKTKINEAKKVLNNIYDIKNQEDAELDDWSNELEEVERKVNFIDNALFEPNN